MDPRDLHARFEDINIEWWDEASGAFTLTPYTCRLMTKDRFLSQFNLPPRRRMIHHDPKMLLPPSRVIRFEATGEVFLIGDHPGIDMVTNKPYAALTTLHTVTPDPYSSGAKATITRMAPEGTANDPGWLQPQDLGPYFCDLANAAVVHETDVVDVYSNSYLVYLPSSVTLRRYDLISTYNFELTAQYGADVVKRNSKQLRVQSVYADSGFHVAKCLEAHEDRVNVIYLRSNVERTFDPVTRRMVGGPYEYKVTVQFAKNHDFAAWSAESQDYKDLIIEVDNIGFRPASQDKVSIDGITYEVKTVDLDRTSRQYRLRVV